MDAKIVLSNSVTDMATVDELPSDSQRLLGFWQHPFVQNVAPMLISLAVHLTIVVAGFFAIKVVQGVGEKSKVQVVSPEMVMDISTTGVANPGINRDPFREAAQDKIDVAGATGLADQFGKDLTATLSGGGSGDNTDGVFGVALNGNGLGTGRGTGNGIGNGHGNGKGDGALAPFGVPGGGGAGPRGIFSLPNASRRIVFVLDATGSMMGSFDDLRRQLKLAINGLRPPQSFNIVFINDRNPAPLALDLLFATPENKRRAEEYVDGMAPRGGTEPLPALQKAYAMKPDLISLLMDPTDIPDRKAMNDAINQYSTGGKVKLNIIAFEGNADPEVTKFLKELALSSGGVYSFKTKKDLAE